MFIPNQFISSETLSPRFLTKYLEHNVCLINIHWVVGVWHKPEHFANYSSTHETLFIENPEWPLAEFQGSMYKVNDNEGLVDVSKCIATVYLTLNAEKSQFSFCSKWFRVAYWNALSISMPTGTTYLVWWVQQETGNFFFLHRPHFLIMSVLGSLCSLPQHQ